LGADNSTGSRPRLLSVAAARLQYSIRALARHPFSNMREVYCRLRREASGRMRSSDAHLPPALSPHLDPDTVSGLADGDLLEGGQGVLVGGDGAGGDGIPVPGGRVGPPALGAGDGSGTSGTGYILAPCHNIQANTPIDNILAMYDEAHRYGRF